MKSAAILVLGDIGRSPRMQNHALQISNNFDCKVYLIGYTDNKPNSIISRNKNIEIIGISTKLIDKIKKWPKFLYILYALIRIIYQILQLFKILFFDLKIKPGFILVQNPPSVPSLFVVFIVCKLRGIKFLIDFHNYGYTIMALGVKNKLLIKIARIYEQFFGKLCDYSFCVSKAMKEDLQKNWNIESQVLYDKANTDIFQPIGISQRHLLFKKLGLVEYKHNLALDYPTYFTQPKNYTEDGIQTHRASFNQIHEHTYRKERPLLLVSSTSWTKDEDFTILFEAMEKYNKMAMEQKQEEIKIIEQEDTNKIEIKREFYPNLVLLISGKGPEKEKYEKYIKQNEQKWKKIQIRTVWLEADDYPKLLASADWGISLHYSSSGFDLPMKVVDMLSTGLPVLTIDYRCIGELIQDGKNGRLFNNSQDLFQLFKELFKNMPLESTLQTKMSDYALNFRKRTFAREWIEIVGPAVQNILKIKTIDKQNKNNENI